MIPIKKIVAVVCMMVMLITFFNLPTQAQTLTTNQQIILQNLSERLSGQYTISDQVIVQMEQNNLNIDTVCKTLKSYQFKFKDRETENWRYISSFSSPLYVETDSQNTSILNVKKRNWLSGSIIGWEEIKNIDRFVLYTTKDSVTQQIDDLFCNIY